MSRIKYSKEQKLQIIKEASEQGVTVTLEKHGIYAATFYSWRKKLDSRGEEGLDFRMNAPQLFPPISLNSFAMETVYLNTLRIALSLSRLKLAIVL